MMQLLKSLNSTGPIRQGLQTGRPLFVSPVELRKEHRMEVLAIPDGFTLANFGMVGFIRNSGLGSPTIKTGSEFLTCFDTNFLKQMN